MQGENQFLTFFNVLQTEGLPMDVFLEEIHWVVLEEKDSVYRRKIRSIARSTFPSQLRLRTE